MDIDIKENDILERSPELLDILLKDHTTQQHIFWATDDYKDLREDYQFDDCIEADKITGKNGNISGKEYQRIHTNDFGGILDNISGSIIEQFINDCKKSGKKLEISYQDEHLKSILGMVFTLQTIEYFVKAIGNDFSLEFLIEKYTDNGNKDRFNTNLPTSYVRDGWLSQIAGKWIAKINDDANGKYTGTLEPITSRNQKALPHWCVLTIKCGKKKLRIYPDGGFMNGWNLKPEHITCYHAKTSPKFYTIDNTYTNDVIPLERMQDIKFDIEVE